MRKLGIDVSDNQGVIDWKKVRDAGVEFSIMRTVRKSGKTDNYLERNVIGCKSNGIPMGFYKYGYALTEEDARREAVEVVNALKGVGVAPSKETVVWYDVEDDSQMALSKNKLTSICKAFKSVIESSGYTFGLYMGKYDFDKGEISLSDFGETHVWIARYYNGYTVKQFGEIPNEKYKPTVPNGELWGWQFTSSGRVDGISGNVDINIAYYDIAGNPQEVPKKTVQEVAQDVINGMYGTGYERKELLEKAGYNYREVQDVVNEILNPYYRKYTGHSVMVDTVLRTIGVPAKYIGDKTNRKPIAEANGIKNYRGTASQNLKIISLAKNGKLKRP